MEDTTPADEVLSKILDWVMVESPSSDATGVNRLVDAVEACFGALGAPCERIAGRDGRGDHLVTRSQARSSNSRRGVLLLCHLDTVHPVGTIEARPIRRVGDRVYGPGIYDMKAGACLAYLAFRHLTNVGGFGLPVTLVFTSDEEVGSPTSRGLIEEQARHSRYALVMEPARAGGMCVTKRLGLAHFLVRATGRAAHAGVDPEHGRSAIAELAHQVLVVEAMNDLPNEIITNVGLIAGGVSVNTVPERAEMKVEVRFGDATRGDSVCQAISGLSAVGDDIDLHVEGGVNRMPFVRTAEQRELFAVAQSAARKCGFELGETATGGASDAAFTQAIGVPTLCGLGAEGGNAHSVDEHILVSRLAPRLSFLIELLRSLR